MRIVVDVMGTPESSGGMNLYARELITAWAETFSNDELIVIGGSWITRLQDEWPEQISTRVVQRNSVAQRFWTQMLTSGWLARRTKADSLLSLSPIVARTFPSTREVAVVHDWRHLKRPDEFGRLQRLYRRLWVSSLGRARVTVTISDKTRTETKLYAPRANAVVVRNGGDHPRRWEPVQREPSDSIRVLTYGHFVNKRPEPVIEAIALLAHRGISAELTVLGARGDYRATLEALAAEAGVAGRVRFPGFVEDSEYQRLFQSVDVVVLNSSDEGFGLPVVEAGYFGIPVIAAEDSGLADIHGSAVALHSPSATGVAEGIRIATLAEPSQTPQIHTWAETARGIRNQLREQQETSPDDRDGIDNHRA